MDSTGLIRLVHTRTYTPSCPAEARAWPLYLPLPAPSITSSKPPTGKLRYTRPRPRDRPPSITLPSLDQRPPTLEPRNLPNPGGRNHAPSPIHEHVHPEIRHHGKSPRAVSWRTSSEGEQHSNVARQSAQHSAGIQTLLDVRIRSPNFSSDTETRSNSRAGTSLTHLCPIGREGSFQDR